MSVYYVLAPDLGLVKIGYAENARARFSKIQSDSPARLVLAAIEDGSQELEAQRHAQFSEHRARGEWFRNEGALSAHIETIPPIPAREPSLNARIVAMGVSRAHASQIVTGKFRPSLSLATAIWRATGWKCPRIAHATDKQLEIIEQIEPWRPRQARKTAA